MTQPLLNEIFAEIERSPHQAIPFSRYMQLALYHPEWGYYQTNRTKLGKEGDFFTNAHVGTVMGRVLGRLFRRMVAMTGNEEEWVLVEMGAGDGRLMEQVANEWLAQGGKPDKLHAYLVETSPYHRRLQQERLSLHPVSFHWSRRLEEVPRAKYSFLYTNELVDAFPVHRIKKEGGAIWEAYVSKGKNGCLSECWFPLKESDDPAVWERGRLLAEGQIAEVSVAAREWLSEVAGWLEKGMLLTIDYGGETEELLARREGTLRAYREHRLWTDLYHTPGEMDLTAHVDFTLLRLWGAQLGLRTFACLSQAEFLLRAGVLDLLPATPARDPFSAEAKQARAVTHLIHPQGMGERFRVLLQGKGVSASDMEQLVPNL
ncbi:class I SAM-dependent methyltransferase [Laceyella tengchongensis]